MKNLKLVLISCFLVLAFDSIAQEPSKAKELIYIRIQESISSPGFDSCISLTYPNQSVQRLELTKLGVKGQGSEENGKKIQLELSKLINQGYDIKSSSTGGDFNITTTTIILTRVKSE